ncbi:MAG: HAD family hydrolase [Limnochordia bacterium]|jgi:phosphoglycolate phosphatase
MQSIEWRSSNVRRDFKAALFDFDGTISLIREGWQPIMYSYFTKVLSEVSPNEPIASLETLVREFVDDLTGKQTIYQCIRLAEEVERRGVKPEDPFVYKDEYNRRLLRHISHRVQALQSGEADPEEYLVPGSVELLKDLRQRGLTLYLASGTDHEYVLEEAAALGVGEYFNGGIYGAVRDFKSFSKEQVIRDLVLPKIESGEALLGFGDGFVEIENVKAVGGIAVGVASNEKDRQGIDPWKRDRLIKAGADVIIGDYRSREALLKELF